MKCLLLFFQLQQPGRPSHLSRLGTVVCLSGTWRNKSVTTANEYVTLTTGSSKEKMKNILFLHPKNTGQISCGKQGILSDFSMLLSEVFNIDIQQLTVGKTFSFPLSFSIPNSSFFRSQGRCSSIFNNLRRYSIYEQTYEHFYRLRSLFGHALQSDRA